MSETQTSPVQHERDTNDTIATRVKKFDFDNEMNENKFVHHCITLSHVKMRLKSETL